MVRSKCVSVGRAKSGRFNSRSCKKSSKRSWRRQLTAVVTWDLFKSVHNCDPTLLLESCMEPPPLIRAPPSHNQQSSKKRTSSPDASTTRTKKSKTDPGQGQTDKDRRKRRRKQKKQTIVRDSGDDSGAVSGNAQNVSSSSLTPASPFPSRATESQPSLVSSQSDKPFDGSSAPSPPPLHLSLGSPSHEQRASCASLLRERVMPAAHSEYKVRLLSVSISNCVQTLHSLSVTTKYSLRALYHLLCVKSVSICFTNPLRFPPAGMSPATAVSSTGSTLISNLMD